MNRFYLLIVNTALVLLVGIGTAADQPARMPSKSLPWQSSSEAGLREAQVNKRPMLIRFEGESCPWCRRLNEEIEKPEVQEALARWTLVSLDIEKATADARAMKVEAIPALRIVSSTGRLLESHDGYLTDEKLIAWLDKSFERASAPPDDVLLSSGSPAPIELPKIIRQFADRDPTTREAAIRRLLPYPGDTSEAVIAAMRNERLSVKLAALELLREWRAPLDDLDPWQPETMTAERLARLDEWRKTISTNDATSRGLTPESLAEVRADIGQMLKVDAVTAAAIRDRLARHKGALLPEVVARLKDATNDEDRSRLLALRYRLVIEDTIALRSPGLVERLAAIDVRTRHQAVQELTEQAGPDTQPLFLELFADTDPLVRELALNGLRTAGGIEGTNSLVKLLDDPEPNVRAAVLKHLAENPWPALQTRLAEFLKTEKEIALLVHAVRCFRKLKVTSPDVMISLLDHAEWQIRAEALDTLTGAWQRYPDDTTRQLLNNAAVKKAILARLDDDDPFVVSRAMLGVKSNINADVVKKLLSVLDKHPSLMKDVVSILSTTHGMNATVLPSLKKFFASRDPAVRATAIVGMGQIAANETQTQLLAALQDEDESVRIAAANALQLMFNQAQPTLSRGRWNFSGPSGVSLSDDDGVVVMEAESAEAVPAVPKPAGGFLQGIVRGLFGGAQNTAPAPVFEPVVVGANNPNKEKEENEKANLPEKRLELALARDAWLNEFHEGKHRPAGFTEPMIAPLKKMFQSQSVAERIASAVPLVALGQGKEILPKVSELVEAGGKNSDDAIDVLMWLPYEERQPLTTELLKSSHAKDFVHKFENVFTHGHDPRDAENLWNLCNALNSEPSELSTVQQGLKQLYFGERYWDGSVLTPSAKKRVYETAASQLEKPRSWRHIVAIALMYEYLPEDSDEQLEQIRGATQAIVDDQELAPDLRDDAYQIVLFGLKKSDQTTKLIELVQTGQPAQQLLALRAMTFEDVGLRSLAHSHLYLIDHRNQGGAGTPRGQQIQPEPPTGLSLDIVRPLLLSKDPQTRALAGYVAAVSGEQAGLASVIDYWRNHAKGNDAWERLVYRAIAATDDSSQLPVLKQIYKDIDQWRVNEFYWTIRIMTGPKILEFRKQIRDEKGADALR